MPGANSVASGHSPQLTLLQHTSQSVSPAHGEQGCFLGSQGFEDTSPLLNPPYTQSLGGAVAHSPGLRGPLMTLCGDTRTVLDSRETVECGSPNLLGVTSTQVTFRGSR